MHPVLVLGLVLLVVVLLTVSGARRAAAAAMRPLLKRTLIAVGVGVLLLLTLTGRLHWLVTLAGVGIPLLYRALAISRMVRSARGPTPGQTSDVETRFLRMSLDHDTGKMTGEVLEGQFRGRRLEDMALDELRQLLAECRGEDPPSAKLLESYLQRAYGEAAPDQDSGRNSAGSASSAIGREEALEILGLGRDASEQQIIEAHRRLMQKLHPDRGGSGYLASQLNRAKDVLLGR